MRRPARLRVAEIRAGPRAVRHGGPPIRQQLQVPIFDIIQMRGDERGRTQRVSEIVDRMGVMGVNGLVPDPQALHQPGQRSLSRPDELQLLKGFRQMRRHGHAQLGRSSIHVDPARIRCMRPSTETQAVLAPISIRFELHSLGKRPNRVALASTHAKDFQKADACQAGCPQLANRDQRAGAGDISHQGRAASAGQINAPANRSRDRLVISCPLESNLIDPIHEISAERDGADVAEVQMAMDVDQAGQHHRIRQINCPCTRRSADRCRGAGRPNARPIHKNRPRTGPAALRIHHQARSDQRSPATHLTQSHSTR